ncbi:YbaK/EbsC family protein [Aestuariicoccus sp. MJ-SS9]|uniref:YbaK/EbsC family protein n=1 Tax=Aestuariicoccus sp. MJ-SS9 TaxID=3079855 RepID=UPI00290D0516|nr:YbaK/EbsC family protein [Aestuariicoccus sp. MJ-SS9]MDU8911271.1 YbaK/EbsC family protein [Aestuariicoccus sp. MJ-SS9]
MSKSLKRVRAALEAAGIAPDIRDVGQARTAGEAADSVGCHLDQIAKSMIFGTATTGDVVLLLTAGGNRVDPALAASAVGEPLVRADAAQVRAQTGFAIGGVSPVGHLTPVRAWIDPRLMAFDLLWAAAGTPRHVFPIAPEALVALTDAVPARFTA